MTEIKIKQTSEENWVKWFLRTQDSIDNWKKEVITRVEEILDYTDEEKKQIDELMLKVHIIDDLILTWKPFYSWKEYAFFILSYTKLPPRLQKHFENIYIEFIKKVWEIKISRILEKPLNSGNYDVAWIKAQVINILSVDRNFDFWIFGSEVVDKIVGEIKYVRQKYWISF